MRAAVLALVATLAYAPAARAATFTVDTLADALDANPGDGLCATAEGACSLRAAIQETNALVGADTVTVPAGTYVLALAGAGEDLAATGDLDVLDDLTVEGAGMGGTTVDGAGLDRVFDVGPVGAPLAAEIRGLTVRGGAPPEPSYGGGIANRSNTTLRLEEVTLTENRAGSSEFSVGGGGGIVNFGDLTIVRSRISRNEVSGTAGAFVQGGGIANIGLTACDPQECSNDGRMEIVDSTVEHNLVDGRNGNFTSLGGGIVNWKGTTTATRSTIVSNRILGSTMAQGGGIGSDDGSIRLLGTTVQGNEVISGSALGGGVSCNGVPLVGPLVFESESSVIVANTSRTDQGRAFGGGLYLGSQIAATLENTTVSRNLAIAAEGGWATGGAVDARGPILLAHSTFTGNRAESPSESGIDGLLVVGAEASFLYSIVDNDCSPDTASALISLGHNIESGSSCGFDDVTDRQDTDPLLGPLGDHGGDTLTHLLLPGSPAIDTGDATNCPETDQRGVPRDDGACDVGAVEVGPQDEAAGILILVVEGRPEGVGYTVGDATAALGALVE